MCFYVYAVDRFTLKCYNHTDFGFFLCAKAQTAIVCLSPHNSVRLSVRPSVDGSVKNGAS